MTDVIVVGAGIVGICTAISLRERGIDVTIIDKNYPGQETSFGNAGVIDRDGVDAIFFPRDIFKVLKYIMNISTEAHYQFSSLPNVLPFLWRYFFKSTAKQKQKTLESNIALFAGCLDAHEKLISATQSSDLIRRNGWLGLARNQTDMAKFDYQMAHLNSGGIVTKLLNAEQLSTIEPYLNSNCLEGAIHWQSSWSCSDPGALVDAYTRYFEKIGGHIVLGEAHSLDRQQGNWRINTTDNRHLHAQTVVLAAGPWTKTLTDSLGIKLPMGIKRGYHTHYRAQGNAVLNRPVLDAHYGYVMSPLSNGLRLTSGAEFASLNAPKTPVQLDRIKRNAHEIFPLDVEIDEEPWLGARPVFPDMLPAIGSFNRFSDLWINTGHGHSGFTLGPVSGELLGAMIFDDTPFIDPAPYSPNRFGL